MVAVVGRGPQMRSSCMLHQARWGSMRGCREDRGSLLHPTHGIVSPGRVGGIILKVVLAHLWSPYGPTLCSRPRHCLNHYSMSSLLCQAFYQLVNSVPTLLRPVPPAVPAKRAQLRITAPQRANGPTL